ncbi:MAG: Fe-S cluster assembly protein SufD, partial [Candidatus Woesearchaeota archaeon]|nr:Fe-S cluster assembly protein SufD [Candidatus Woesearchaeota archaeon]
IKKPIQIRYDIKQSPFISNIFILAGKNAKAQILINKVSSNVPSKVSSNKASYVADDVRIISGPNSKIEFITIQNLSKKTINVQRRNALTKKNAEVNWIDICLGTKYTKSDVITSLVDEGATAKNTVLFLGSQEQQYDLYTASLHKSPNTFSDIVTKGVLNDKSKALSRGLVRIEKNAAGSNGYETQDVLILSEKAEADAIPNLEIENNDVKCSHGSTVGQIDKDKLFYLMSRGLAESEAKMKIVEGYFTPVLDLFKDPDLKDKVHNSITKAMG